MEICVFNGEEWEWSEVGGRAKCVYKLIWKFDLFDVRFVVLPRHVHKVDLTCVFFLSHIELLAEEVWVLDLYEWLNVSVTKVNQVNWVFVACDYVRQLSELFREEWLEVGGMRIVPRIFDLLRFGLRGAINHENTGLVPYAYKESPLWQ